MQELLTQRFYKWEILGRGWMLSDEPVELEPPYTPFFGHTLPKTQFVDDGVHETFITSFLSLFSKKENKKLSIREEPISLDPYPFYDDSPLIELRIVLSSNPPISKHVEQFLTMCTYCTRPISFEIEGRTGKTQIRFVCREPDARYIKSQVVMYFLDIRIQEIPIDVDDFFSENLAVATVDFGLKEEFMRALAFQKDSVHDTLSGIITLCEQLQKDERVVVQILFNGLVNFWEGSVMRSVTNKDGDPFFADAPDMVPLAKEKIQEPFIAATIRVATQAPHLDAAFSLLKKASFAIQTMSQSPGNTLMPLPDEGYTVMERLADMALRESHRVGMLLNVKELATFVHIPAIETPSLVGKDRKTKKAPLVTADNPLCIGINVHDGIEERVTLSTDQRLRHIHITGATGTGKSTLLHSMIAQDIGLGNGVCILDPHGDLIDQLVLAIPSSRVKDVIVLDPSDIAWPIGFNILKAHSDIEKEVLASDLVSSFRRFATSWGDQMTAVLANAILAFLESDTGGTLADVRRFLIEKSFRGTFLKSVDDPHILYYWNKEYPLLKSNSIGPILTRLDAFLRPRLIRNMVCQKQGLDFESILNQRKILLVKLSQGLIGTENSYLLGSFVVSKIHQAALARQSQTKRPDFFCYIDEFQHFVTPSMEHLVTGARKYRVGLTLAHQGIDQLQKQSPELLQAIVTNVGTRITFRVGDQDAKKLADGFSSFSSEDIQNLKVGEAIGRIDTPQNDFSFNTEHLDEQKIPYATKEEVLDFSRKIYANSQKDVESYLASLVQFQPESETQKIGEGSDRTALPQNDVKRNEKKNEKVVSKLDPELTEAQKDETIERIAKKKDESRHRYIQQMIKKGAEVQPYNYKATIEAQTPDGKGKVDVLLERGDERIACEVSVTTDAPWEMHNIEKCLQAGYSRIIAVIEDKTMKIALSNLIEKRVDSNSLPRISISSPEDFFNHLLPVSKHPKSTESNIKGYRVNVEYVPTTAEEQVRKQKNITQLIIDSVRKSRNFDK